MDPGVRGGEAVVSRHLAQLHGQEIAGVEGDGPPITGGDVAEAVGQGHGDVEGLANNRSARDGQAEVRRLRRDDLNRQAAGDGGLYGVDGGNRLRPGSIKGGGEAAGAAGQRRVGGQHHAGRGVAAAEVHGAGVVRIGVPVRILGCHGERETRPGGGRRGGGDHDQLAGGRGDDCEIGRRGEAARRVGGGQALRSGSDKGGGEAAGAAGQRRVGGQHHAGRGVAAAEVHGARVVRIGVPVRILRGHGQAEGVAGGGPGGGGGRNELAGRRGVHRQAGGCGQRVRRVGRRQRLGTGLDQLCREAALAVRQRRVDGQHNAG